ncbi:MAG: GNAT family N-acetyltransferase [Deltaproteobacteria bacterium]|nr:GNAT family N-acetyltransferase [Deltaproteobacteria bacterium]
MKNLSKSSKSTKAHVRIRTLTEKDLSDADRIFRLAFGTWHGLPDPLQFGSDANFCRTRWLIDATATFGAEIDGKLVGSNFVATWGNVGFFGPLTVLPDHWNKGIARQLMAATVALFKDRGVVHSGCFTMPDSPKHHFLYQEFGFWPRFLTPMMSLSIKPKAFPSYATYYSDTGDEDRDEILTKCRNLTDAIFKGLDLEIEITAVRHHGLGDTVLLWEDSRLAGFAVCHCGAQTEAGSDTCYIKFGAVRPGSHAEENFGRLLDACKAMAVDKGMSRLVAGMNSARHEAYRKMFEHGFRTDMLGVIMQQPNEPGYNRPGVYVIDDWR